MRLGNRSIVALAMMLLAAVPAGCTNERAQKQMMQDVAADAVADAVAPLEGRIDDLENQVSDLETTVANLEANVQNLEGQLN